MGSQPLALGLLCSKNTNAKEKLGLGGTVSGPQSGASLLERALSGSAAYDNDRTTHPPEQEEEPSTYLSHVIQGPLMSTSTKGPAT